MTTRIKRHSLLSKILRLKTQEMIFKKGVKRNKVLKINGTSHMKLIAKTS